MKALSAECLPPHIQAAIEVGKLAPQYGRGRVMVAGGAAYDLIMTSEDQLPLVFRTNERGAIRDLDLLCASEVDSGALIRAILVNSHTKGFHADNDLARNVIIDDDSVVLKHHNSRLPVNPAIFEPVLITIQGVDIPVVRPQTLNRLFALTDGIYREKHRPRSEALRTVFSNYPLQFPETDYLVFDRFQQEKLKYPITRVILQFAIARERSAHSPVRWVKRHVPGGNLVLNTIRYGLFRTEEELVGRFWR